MFGKAHAGLPVLRKRKRRGAMALRRAACQLGPRLRVGFLRQQGFGALDADRQLDFTQACGRQWRAAIDRATARWRCRANNSRS